MTKFILFCYSLAVDDEYAYYYEHGDPDIVAKKAIQLSSEDGGKYTYRMEEWEDNRLIGKMRFFQTGKEITFDITNELIKAIDATNALIEAANYSKE